MHLAEPREGIPDVHRVVNRQSTSTARIDVREGAVGKLRALFRAERWHALMFARTDAAIVSLPVTGTDTEEGASGDE
jgi:hypothetical protein